MNIPKPYATNKIYREKHNYTDDDTSKETALHISDDDYDFMSHSDAEMWFVKVYENSEENFRLYMVK